MINITKIPEILAPCGSYESFIAAVNAGADACYAGGNKFGARAYANNFSETELLNAIEYAHLSDVKLYLTVNTLFKEYETSQLYDFLLPYYKHGLDAVIVQDLGAFHIIKKLFPDINIHCSTQMNITSKYAADFMKKNGASRVVIPREMSLDEIKELRENVDIEIEAFVHGALCYSYSGQCLLSSVSGNRSGNRGRCAQPCRKAYDCSYDISMKDLCSLEHIPNLISAGIDSFKIEGRMKNSYYIASAVDAYKELTNDYLNDCFNVDKAKRYKFKLANIFNRGGFCNGYFFNHNGPDMITKTRPDHQGVAIGKLISSSNGKITISVSEKLYKGDVLELLLTDNSTIDITVGVDAKKGSRVLLNAPKTKLIKKEQTVYRMMSKHIIDTLDISTKKIPLTGEFYAEIGKPISLSLSCNLNCEEYSITSFGCITEESKQVIVNKDDIREKLTQLGATRYYFDVFNLNISDNAFIPASAIKKLRRDAISMLEEKIKNSFKRENLANNTLEKSNSYVFNNNKSSEKSLSYNVSVKSINQLNKVLKYDFVNGVYLNNKTYNDAKKLGVIDEIISKKIKIYLELPYIIKNTFNFDEYTECKHLDGIYIRNIDELSIISKLTKDNKLSKDVLIICGSSLYAYNTYARKFILDKTKDTNIIFEIPKELNFKEIEDINPYPSELTIYEYQQVMLSAQCVKKTRDMCTKKYDIEKLTDDKNNIFYSQAICDECCNVIYNGQPLFIYDKLDSRLFYSLCVKSFKISFTIESEAEVNNILSKIKSMHSVMNLDNKLIDFKRTTGQYYRGVE